MTGSGVNPLRRDDAGILRTFRRRAMYEIWMEAVVADENCQRALEAVVRNQGAAGIDRMTTPELEPHLQAHGWILKDKLLKGSYVPTPVRRVEIPKPTGGARMLGIPTVQDRFIQQLLLQVLTPIFDPQFSEHSYGFRPGRSAQVAMRAAQKYGQEGKGGGYRHPQVLRPRQSRHPDGTDRACDPGQAGVAFDRGILAAGSHGGGVGASQRGRHAARRAAIAAAGEHLLG